MWSRVIPFIRDKVPPATKSNQSKVAGERGRVLLRCNAKMSAAVAAADARAGDADGREPIVDDMALLQVSLDENLRCGTSCKRQ